jgi:hypothetical protein
VDPELIWKKFTSTLKGVGKIHFLAGCWDMSLSLYLTLD